MELKKINHNSRVTSDGGDSIRIVVRQDSYFLFVFAYFTFPIMRKEDDTYAIEKDTYL